MKKKWTGMLLALILLTGLVACTGKQDTNEKPQKETVASPNAMSDEKILKMFDEINKEAKRLEGYWYYGYTDTLEVDTSADPIIEKSDYPQELMVSSDEVMTVYWYPVLTYKTMEELKSETGKYFTEEYSEIVHYNNDTFKDINGVLYVRTYNGEISATSEETETGAKIISSSGTEIVIDIFYSADDYSNLTYKYSYFLKPSGNTWLISNKHYGSDSSHITPEMVTELEELTALMEKAEQPLSDAPEDIAAAVATQKGILDSKGYAVRSQNHDVANLDELKAFFNGDEKGYVGIYYLDGYDDLQLMGEFYQRDDDGLFVMGNQIFKDLFGNYYYQNFGGRDPLTSGEITDNGNFILGRIMDDNVVFTGYRFVHQPAEYTAAYDSYITPINHYSGLQLGRDWEKESGYQGLSWQYIFEELWMQKDEVYLYSEESPYAVPTENSEYSGYITKVLVPAQVVEEDIQKYFSVTPDELKELVINDAGEQLYQAETNSYAFDAYNGDYTDNIEVWGIEKNSDSSLSITTGITGVYDGNDGNEYSILTVMPNPDGGFTYISNVVL